MLRPYVRGPGGLALILGLTLLLTSGSQAENNQPAPDAIRIGMISTLFRDTPEGIALAMMQPFGALMESQTGVPGQLVPGGDCDALADQLAADKVQLGVFHGIEFAWARIKYPELKPLVIAINQHRQLHAYLVVHGDSPISCVGDLKGKSFALPRLSREHCRVYVHHHCRQGGGCEPDKYFTALSNPANIEVALDDVVDQVVDATVVDRVGLDCYQRRKPGRFGKLKTVHCSEAFPAAVVAYRPGMIDEAKLEKFRNGMIKAHETGLGRQLLNLWKLTGFEKVPINYDQNLAEIAKAYPPACMDK
jgi:ABC-type phosphate/phosphonate transport system substrate-binding protein